MDLREALLRPSAYPFPVDAVETLETHISVLFFAGERVFKVKKSVDLGFLDFTSVELRRHYCEEEVRLNSRLSPEVYIGIVPLQRGADGALRIGGDGETVDWAVEMIRLPEDRMLASLLDAGEIDNEQMNRLVELLADFHGRGATGTGVDEYGAVEMVAGNVNENFAQTLEFTGGSTPNGLRTVSRSVHAFLKKTANGWLDAHRDLLEKRVREGRIRDGHGDLHAGNICFTKEGVVVYDCIEFSERFRCGDVACDLAFLAMDLDHRGYPGFSGYLVHRYAELVEDEELVRLVNFYKGYRAVVRAKVASITAGGRSGVQREEQRLEAMRYFQLAASYELPPAMILMCGLPATGKTWIAHALARTFRAAVHRSDVRRKQLAGIALHEHREEGFRSGAYSPEMSARTYAALLAGAEAELTKDRTVIIDANFATRAQRAAFLAAAERQGRAAYVVHVTASEAVVRGRMQARAGDPHAISDADLAVYLAAKEHFEAPAELEPGRVLLFESPSGVVEELGEALVERRLADTQ